jgi:8-amino-7-oxononanoate synthase
MDWIEEELRDIQKQGLYRERRLLDGLLDFCSNDYLALSRHPRVIEASKKALTLYGLGSGASQLVSGYTQAHRELELALAKFKSTPSCLLFGSGFLANAGTIPALVGEGDLILSDELNHASIIDGCRLSRAERRIFKHTDYESVRKFLEKERHRYKKVLLITDGVFSMEGDIAHIPELYDICERFGCMLYIDEAHATGTIGNGFGSLREFGLEWKEFVILMGTLSKALGSYGAFVCGSQELIELLVNRSRSLIFSTSLPPSMCAGARESLEIISSEPELIKRLKDMQDRIHNMLLSLGLEVIFHNTPIIPIVVGKEEKSLEIARRLSEKGIFLQAIRYPTVPRGRARLRLTASLRYSEEDLDRLKEALGEVFR